MKHWLIEIIHNIDMICNGIFWFIPLFLLIGYSKSGELGLTISYELRNIWFGACLGVLFIPSKETLMVLLA